MDAIDELRRRNLIMRLEAALLDDLEGFVDKLNTEATRADASKALVASVSKFLERLQTSYLEPRVEYDPETESFVIYESTRTTR